jgi:hypothetical protein
MRQGRSISERLFLFTTLKAAADYGRNQANAVSQIEVFGFREDCRQYGSNAQFMGWISKVPYCRSTVH